MQRFVLLITLALIIASCGQTKKQDQGNDQESTHAKEVVYLELGEFMKTSLDNIGKEVYIKGTVNHVCSHSGRRCFIVDATGEQSLRIEATGDIKQFDRAVSGSDIMVTGIVREKRLEPSYLDEWEAKVKAKEKNIEEDGEHCATELSNIQEMRDWMKANNKDYYSIIYVDGTSYKTADEKAEI